MRGLWQQGRGESVGRSRGGAASSAWIAERRASRIQRRCVAACRAPGERGEAILAEFMGL